MRISISGVAYPPRCISGRRLHGAAEDKTGKEKTMESKKDPEKGKKKKEKREKPKYNLWQNTGFMLRAAFNSCKSVPFMCLALALTASGKAVLELLVTPTVLSGWRAERGLEA